MASEKAKICIPPIIMDKIEKLLEDKQITDNIFELAKMSYVQRVMHYAEHLDPNLFKELSEKTNAEKESFLNAEKRKDKLPTLSEFIASEFDKENAMQTRTALKNWRKTFFKSNAKKIYEKVFGKILRIKAETDALKDDMFDNMTDDFVNDSGLLTDYFYGEIAEMFNITPLQKKEIDTITNLAEQIQAEYDKSNLKYQASLTDEQKLLPENNIKYGGFTRKYWQLLFEMREYTYQLNPAPILEQILATWTRIAMLFSGKSPLTNIIANTTEIVSQVSQRLLKTYRIMGKTGMVTDYMADSWSVFWDTGFDLSRTLAEFDATKEWAGETQTADLYIKSLGKGKVNAFLKGMQTGVFKYGQGAYDNITAAFHFGNQLDIMATLKAEKEINKNVAEYANMSKDKIEKLVIERARELFIDASKIHPKTRLGEELRLNAIEAAQIGTHTEKSEWQRVPNLFRNFFNLLGRPFGIQRGPGETIIAFAKVPTNAVAKVIKMGGGTLINNIMYISKYLNAKNTVETEEARKKMWDSIKESVWSGIMFALILSLVEPEDYIGEIAYNKRDLEYLRKGIRNSIKIGGTWYSLDYLGTFGAPIVAAFTAKKYGDNLGEALYFYSKAFMQQLLRIPGFKETTFAVTSALKFSEDTKGFDFDEKTTAVGRGVVDFVTVRLIPMLFSDLFYSMNVMERADYNDIWQVPKRYIRGVLPTAFEKKEPIIDLFGEPVSRLSTYYLFGNRVSFDNRNDLWDELNRLNNVGMLPDLRQLDKLNGEMKRIKELYGEKIFTKIMIRFGELWERNKILVKTPEYLELNDEGRKDLINSWRKEIIKAIKKEFPTPSNNLKIN